jgi:cyclophilin family peptidyl-prolyl cis-trans isomerase
MAQIVDPVVRGRGELEPRRRLARAKAADEPAAPSAAAKGAHEPDFAPVGGGACASGRVFAQTELGGEVVRWGHDHRTESAGECCAACASAAGCNVFVHCAAAQACGADHKQCWLKRLEGAWDDLDLVQGLSSRWTSGIVGARPSPTAPAAVRADARAPDFALVTEAGEVRVRLFAEAAPVAAAFFRALLAAAPACANCRFYRAEPVMADWGSAALPDSWDGGRWGPPYALMQGSFMPAHADAADGVLPPKPAAELSAAARPLIRRGMLAWAGGGGGPDAFLALAPHPEWGHGHTVWGEVVADDMSIVDQLMRRPIKTENWGTITASVFETPLAFTLRAL